MTQALQKIEHTTGGDTDEYANAKKDGWITAGRFYQYFSGASNSQAIDYSQAMPTMSKTAPDTMADAPFYSAFASVPAATTDMNNSYNKLRDEYSPRDVEYKGCSGDIVAYAACAIEGGASGEGPGVLTNKLDIHNMGGSSSGKAAKVVIGIFTGGVTGAITYWEHIFSAKNVNPIVAVTSLGNKMVEQATMTWMLGGVAIFLLVLFGGIAPCANALGLAVLSYLMWTMPLMMAILTAMFSAGAVLAFYIPLIPFILFLFGTIGWIIGVVESMIAAPIVAIGVTHPEGHEAYGRAEPAVMLLVSIFMRPTLMIFGFIFGILLSFVGLKILNMGFGPAVANIDNASGNGWTNMFRAMGLIVVYTALVVAIINKSFSLIHAIPNQVLRWLSGGEQAQFGGSGGEEQAVMGAVSGGAQAFGAGAKGQFEGTAQAGFTRSKEMQEKYNKQGKKGLSGGLALGALKGKGKKK